MLMLPLRLAPWVLSLSDVDMAADRQKDQQSAKDGWETLRLQKGAAAVQCERTGIMGERVGGEVINPEQ